MRRLRWWLGAMVALVLVACLGYFFSRRTPHPKVLFGHGLFAIQRAKIYASPELPPIEGGTLLVSEGVIAALGTSLPVPPGAQLLPCNACTVVAGFWNAHVHFTEPKWSLAGWKDSALLNFQLAEMLTSRGFTTVVDAGSDLGITLSLRRRIESGELRGPAIYTAGEPLFPPHGVPYFLKKRLPFYAQWQMEVPSSPSSAAQSAERNIARGADLLKLFTGSPVEPGEVQTMPTPIAKAAVEVAHRHGQVVYSHPSNLAGARVAMDSGVDVLAHALDTAGGADAQLLRGLVDHHMAMIPTFTMFATLVSADPAYLQRLYDQVSQFHQLGGQLLFGTDAGSITNYRTEEEFRALERAGLRFPDILRMLTTAPAERFGVSEQRGTLAAGKAADLVILDRDPAQDIAALAQARLTMRNGRILYRAP